MKLNFLCVLVCFNLSAMHRPRSKSETKTKPTSSHQSVFMKVSADLKIAIRDLDLSKTQAALKKIEAMDKKNEELLCLQTETSCLVVALKFHYETVSARVAKLAAGTAVERYTDPRAKQLEFPSASHAAIFNHGTALAIHDTVINFFTTQWRQQPECIFSLPIQSAAQH